MARTSAKLAACLSLVAPAATTGDLPSSMRAWYIDHYPEPLNYSTALNFSASYPVPEAQAGEVVVQVKASSVNPIDYKILEPVLHGAFPVSLPAVFGFEGAGVVMAVGANTTGRLKKGDEVWLDLGNEFIGTYADFAAAPEDLVALKPSGMSFEEAATLPLVGCTSMQALAKIDANTPLKGKTVLILGGSGGTGSVAIQLAKHVYGAAKVITTTSAGNFDFVRGLGVDQAIDYHEDNWWEVLENGTVDGIYDTVGQSGTGPLATAMLAEDGVFITIAHKGPAVGLDANPKPNTVQIYHKLSKANAVGDLDTLKAWVESGKLKAAVSNTYSLEELPAAWEESNGGHVQGKLAVSHSLSGRSVHV